MRKSTKIILTTALIFFGLGIVFTTIGGITSKGRYTLEEIFNDKGINLTSAKYKDFEKRDYYLLDGFDADDIENIKIQLDVSALKITKSKDDKCNIYVESDTDREIYANLYDGLLEISDDDDKDNFHVQFHFGFFENIGRVRGVYVILELPEKTYENLEAYVDMGCILGDNINVSDTCRFEVAAGSVEVEDIEASDMELSSDMGNIETRDVKVSSMNIDCNMGNIDIKNADAQQSVLDCDMGNIDVNFIGNSNEYEISKDVDMGSVNIKESKRDCENVRNKRTIEVNCDMGSVDVTFKE